MKILVIILAFFDHISLKNSIKTLLNLIDLPKIGIYYL